jgi:hypothetical protein
MYTGLQSGDEKEVVVEEILRCVDFAWDLQ